MKNSEFVLKISSLWREQKRREFLYLEALKKDKMGTLRRMLSQGHFSALLFQKEIQSLYDYFKCFLTDRDLQEAIPAPYVTESGLDGLEEKEQVAGYLKCVESKILLSYKALHKHLDRDSDTRRIIDGHLQRISEFCEFLAKQETMTSPNLR